MFEVVDHYPIAASCATRRRRQADRRGRPRRSRDAADRRAEGVDLTMVTLKRAADREDAPRRPLVAEVLALVESELQPGMTTGELDRIAEDTSAAPAPSRRSWAARSPRAPFPASCASRSTTRSSTASPATATIREGQIVSVDAGAIVDGWHGDAARTLRRRRAAGPRSASWSRRPARDDGRHRRGRARRTASGDISARRRGRRRAAARLRHRPPVRRPRHRHRDARGAAGPQLPHRPPGGGSSPGLCLAIEPMFTLGSHEVEVRPRRLDGRHRATARWPPTGSTRSP